MQITELSHEQAAIVDLHFEPFTLSSDRELAHLSIFRHHEILLTVRTSQDEVSGGLPVGRLSLYALNADSAGAFQKALADLSSSPMSVELLKVCQMVFPGLHGARAELSQDLEELVGFARGRQVFYLETVEIYPEHRRKGYGFTAMKVLLQQFAPAGSIAILRAAPPPAAKTSRDAQASIRKKLREFYGAMGFQVLPGTDYMAINVDSFKTLVNT